MKTCFKCKEEKELTNFHKHKGMKDGHLNKCASCVVKDVGSWRAANEGCRKRETARAKVRRGFKPIGRKVISSRYMLKRRLQKEQLPKTELDLFIIDEGLLLCGLREEATGKKWHLDHIVPLNHKAACGLHVAANFQVVPSIWNVTKGNRNMDLFFKRAYAGY